MKSNLLFDFSVDKENKTIRVQREFAAELPLVWKAWTTSELLDQWWAPKPYRVETKSMDFREGGRWLYAMISPQNEKFWSRVDYQAIDPHKSFSHQDAFCDEDGNLNESFPPSRWHNAFRKDEEDKTTVHVTIGFDELADLEKLIEMGFKEGFTMGLGNLDELLNTLQKGAGA